MFGSAQERLAQAQARVGQTLKGKYRIDRVIGVGGMASVYAATHRNGRRVAVKVLHTAASLHSDMRKRFLREGQAANAVNHPGAVVVVDDDVAEDGAAFIVMELLEGEVVERVWQRNADRLPVQMVLAIGYELCGVLDAAHRAGIVHRDIKPENLFLTRDAQLKVLDFGLAQLREGPKLTAVGMVFGTPAFMAPEQAAGRASQIDARTDIWSVGATMFALLSGRTVHEAPTVQDVLVLAATKPARSLAMVMPDADARLVNLVDRATAPDRNARWPSAEAMRTAIGATSKALFGVAEPKVPTPGELAALQAYTSNHATVDESARKQAAAGNVRPRGQDISIVDLSDSGEYRDSGPASERTEVDTKLPPRPSDAPTALHQRSPAAPAPGLSALHEEIESGRSLGGHPTVADPVEAQTLHRPPLRSDPMAWAPVGPPTPPGVWGAAGSSPRLEPPPPVHEITARRLPPPVVSVGRSARAQPETMLVVIVVAAIVASLVVLVALARRGSSSSSPDASSATSASATRPMPKR